MNEIYQYVTAHHDQLSTIGLSAIFVARLVAALTPTKADDGAIGSIDKFFRRLIEFISGANHSALVKKEEETQPATEDEDDNQLDQFQRVLKQFGAELRIVPIKSKGDILDV